MNRYICKVCGGGIDHKGFCEQCGAQAGSTTPSGPGPYETLGDLSGSDLPHGRWPKPREREAELRKRINSMQPLGGSRK